MAKIRRSRQRRGLIDAAVLFEDRTDRSPDIFNVTQLGDELAVGKNGFRVQGSGLLRPGSPVEVEVLDSRDGVIYHETRDYAEDQARVVGVYVYADTPPGPATVTLMAEAARLPSGEPVPAAWEGKLNVRWTRRVNVNPNVYNSDPIRFERPPELLVFSEEYEKKVPVLADALSSFEAVGAYLPPIDIVEGLDVDLDLTDYSAFPAPRADLPDSLGGEPDVPERVSTVVLPETQYGRGYLVAEAEGFSFNRQMRGRLLVVSSSALPLEEDLVGRITRVISARRARYELLTPAYRSYLRKIRLRGVEDFSIIYRREPVSFEVRDRAVFSVLQIGFLKTIVGEAARVRVYSRLQGENDAFQQVGDYEVEPAELLTDRRPERTSLVRPAGTFRDQDDVDRYLELNTPAVSAPLAYDEDVLLGAARLAPLAGGADAEEHAFSFDLDFLDITFFQYSEYTLSFESAFAAQVPQDARLEVVVSGDAFAGRRDVIARVDLSSATYDQRLVTQNFFPLATARASSGVASAGAGESVRVSFRVTGAEGRSDWAWYVRDVSIRPAQEHGFSPDYAILRPEVDLSRFSRDEVDRIEYKVDVFDLDNNKAGVSITSQ